MSKRVIVVLVILFSIKLNSQNLSQYKVLYKRDPKKLSVTIQNSAIWSNPPYTRLVFNDTISFCFTSISKKDKRDKKGEFIVKEGYHGFYFKPQLRKFYTPSKLSKKRSNVLVEIGIPNELWIFQNDSMMKSGYLCKSAYHITEKNDTVVVWFTPEIPLPYGPYFYQGFPGLVIEVFDQRTNEHIWAKEIIQEHFIIRFPSWNIVSPEELKKMNIQKY